jgi:hypothetical protein
VVSSASSIQAACPAAVLCSTKTVYKDLNPTFDEFFEVGNLPGGTSVLVEVRIWCRCGLYTMNGNTKTHTAKPNPEHSGQLDYMQLEAQWWF